MSMRRKLRAARKAAKMTQAEVAAHVGITQNTYSNWEKGVTTGIDDASWARLSRLLKVPVDELQEVNDVFGGQKIPVLGRVQAGIPIDANEDVEGYEEITPEMADSGPHFALVVRGNSMEPRMRAGDIVIVRQQADVSNGDIAVVAVNGEDATVKRVIKKETGIVLQAINPSYEPQFFTNED